MKFTHEVKHNGVYYPAGADVPIETKESEGVKAPAPLVSGKDTKDEVQANSDIVFAEFDKNMAKKKYTEQDLAGKKYFALKGMAKAEGFNVPNDAKSDEIKKMLLSVEV